MSVIYNIYFTEVKTDKTISPKAINIEVIMFCKHINFTVRLGYIRKSTCNESLDMKVLMLGNKSAISFILFCVLNNIDRKN